MAVPPVDFIGGMNGVRLSGQGCDPCPRRLIWCQSLCPPQCMGDFPDKNSEICRIISPGRDSAGKIVCGRGLRQGSAESPAFRSCEVVEMFRLRSEDRFALITAALNMTDGLVPCYDAAVFLEPH